MHKSKYQETTSDDGAEKMAVNAAIRFLISDAHALSVSFIYCSLISITQRTNSGLLDRRYGVEVYTGRMVIIFQVI